MIQEHVVEERIVEPLERLRSHRHAEVCLYASRKRGSDSSTDEDSFRLKNL